jgi:endonuclease/exonuclease/phosphatase (EEP) superfamily protein YafD
MAVNWNKDIDAALSQARSEHKPVLVDFSAAPA